MKPASSNASAAILRQNSSSSAIRTAGLTGDWFKWAIIFTTAERKKWFPPPTTGKRGGGALLAVKRAARMRAAKKEGRPSYSLGRPAPRRGWGQNRRGRVNPSSVHGVCEARPLAAAKRGSTPSVSEHHNDDNTDERDHNEEQAQHQSRRDARRPRLGDRTADNRSQLGYGSARIGSAT
jgi:hypothetical protein